jgi:leucyl aminopeptidase
MSVTLKKPTASCVPIHLTDSASWATHRQSLSVEHQAWAQRLAFQGKVDSHLLLPDAQGRLAAVWVGVRSASHPFGLATLPKALPEGTYQLGSQGLAPDAAAAVLAWHLGSYQFTRYKVASRPCAQLRVSANPSTREALTIAEALCLTRDLVNTPAEEMGPAELSAAVARVAAAHGAQVSEIVGDELLARGFPAIHAVGRAAARAPRLIELNWGEARHPRLTLVGKGVCFDSGGLNIKPGDSMRLMKKDMGGAANALGLAQIIMALKLPVRLQLLIPAVENAIAGNAFRPGDVFKTRQGLHIEIGNTDAEGRVILCDALTYAAEAKPDFLIDFATLTGAARVALGAQLPALFSRDTALARTLMDLSLTSDDPLWHLPLWQPYHGQIESDIADIVNTGKGPLGGAITAALFLADFVPETQPWVHLDLFAWNDASRPGRPAGGEAQTLRTWWAWLKQRYGA